MRRLALEDPLLAAELVNQAALQYRVNGRIWEDLKGIGSLRVGTSVEDADQAGEDETAASFAPARDGTALGDADDDDGQAGEPNEAEEEAIDSLDQALNRMDS